MFQPPVFEPGTSDASSEPTEARSLGARLGAFALAQLLKAKNHLAQQGEARHAGIHEARKCLRRVRATLALGSASLWPSAAPLNREVSRLCRGLSSLRDAQALIEALLRLDDEVQTSTDWHSEALNAARVRRDETLTRALARDPNFSARQRRLVRAESRMVHLDWQSVSTADVHHALARSERRLHKAGRRARRHRHDDQAWHTLRRRLRRLRQQYALLEDIEPGLVRSGKNLDEQANALGESQDDALLLARCSRGSPFSIEVRRQLRSVARKRLGQTRSLPH